MDALDEAIQANDEWLNSKETQRVEPNENDIVKAQDESDKIDEELDESIKEHEEQDFQSKETNWRRQLVQLDYFKKYTDNLVEQVNELYNMSSGEYEIMDLDTLINLETQFWEMITDQKKLMEKLKLKIEEEDSQMKLELTSEKVVKEYANGRTSEVSKYKEIEVRALTKEHLKKLNDELIHEQFILDKLWTYKNFLDRKFAVVQWELRRQERLS